MSKNKPTVGIVTFWDSQDNYGQLLQCYALQQALMQAECEPFLIKYDHTRKSKVQIIIQLLSILFSFQFGRIWKFMSKKNNIKRGFDTFRETYIKSTDKIYSKNDLKNNPPVYDFYVCGSDQIWSQTVYDEGFFLDFGNESIPRIAYAASFGAFNPSDSFIRHIARPLENFKIITVREQSGIDICKKAKILNPLCVPDPTLLLTQQDYSKLMVNNATLNTRKDYLLLYLIGWNTNINLEEIECFAKQKGLDIKYVPSQYTGVSKFPKTYPSIQEWLFLIANARYVLTNSFHGTVFSIIFNKQFGVYSLQGKMSKMNDRITNFLDNVNLNNRIVSTSLKMLDHPIEYERINNILDRDREKISKLFKEWFQK